MLRSSVKPSSPPPPPTRPAAPAINAAPPRPAAAIEGRPLHSPLPAAAGIAPRKPSPAVSPAPPAAPRPVAPSPPATRGTPVSPALGKTVPSPAVPDPPALTEPAPMAVAVPEFATTAAPPPAIEEPSPPPPRAAWAPPFDFAGHDTLAADENGGAVDDEPRQHRRRWLAAMTLSIGISACGLMAVLAWTRIHSGKGLRVKEFAHTPAKETPAPIGSATASGWTVAAPPLPSPAARASAPSEGAVPAASATGASNVGNLNVSTRGGHRVWVDERLVGDSPAIFRVRCGVRSVRIGSQGDLHHVRVPCGGDVEIR